MSLITLKKVKPLSFDLEIHKINRTTLKWKDSNGKEISVSDMPIEYLKNVAKMIEDGRHSRISTYTKLYQVIEREIEYKRRYGEK